MSGRRTLGLQHDTGGHILIDTEALAIDLKGRIPQPYIAIEGPIGVGKTTLARQLSDLFDYQLLLEDAHDNPFLTKFYENRRQNALATCG